MINEEIADISKRLQSVVNTQMGDAKAAIDQLPEGDVKKKLAVLLKAASSGKLDINDAKRELAKIANNAR